MKNVLINSRTLGKISECLIESCKTPDKYTVSIGEAGKRSISSNALFHKWVSEIANHFCSSGITKFNCGAPVNKDTVKMKLKVRFLPTHEALSYSYSKKKLVKRIEPVRTRDLKAGEMYHFMKLVKVWCNESGIPITIPEDSTYHQWARENGDA